MQKIRFGLMGYGAWGRHHAQAIAAHPEAELAAVSASSESSRAAARADHPRAAVTGDYRELAGRDDVDAVAIVLPPYLHFDAARAALGAGKHVLLEKPMALEVARCDELIELARSRGRRLAIGHELRLSSLWGRVKAMIDAGAIGEPKHVLVELWRQPYRQGSGGWRYDTKRVGSWILEEPIHFFDFARWYLQAFGEPVSVQAQSSSARKDRPELPDNFSALLRFSNGAYAVISQTLAGYEHHQTVKVTGTGGALWASWSGAMDRTLHPTFWLRHFDGRAVRDVPIEKVTGEVYELADQVETVVRAIRSGAPLHATGEDGRWSVALSLAAEEAARTGAAVSLAAFTGRGSR